MKKTVLALVAVATIGFTSLAAPSQAEARWRGQPTADAASIDIDVVLAAQAWMYRDEGEFAVIATLNKKHLAQFVAAEHWKDIHPG